MKKYANGSRINRHKLQPRNTWFQRPIEKEREKASLYVTLCVCVCVCETMPHTLFPSQTHPAVPVAKCHHTYMCMDMYMHVPILAYACITCVGMVLRTQWPQYGFKCAQYHNIRSDNEAGMAGGKTSDTLTLC